MVLPLSVLKTASQWLFTSYWAASKIRNFFFLLLKTPSPPSTSSPHQLPSLSSPPAAADHIPNGKNNYSLLFNFHVSLLRSTSVYPFFMATAFEAGGPLRATLLLLFYPLVLLLGLSSSSALRLVVFVTFCGMKCDDMDIVKRAVLPKIYMEEIDRRCYDAAAAAGRRVVVSTSMPTVMVKRFVKECFGVSEVLGPELEVVGGRYFTGRFSGGGTAAERLAAVKCRFEEGEKADVGIVNLHSVDEQLSLIIPYSKEVYVLNAGDDAAKNSAAAGADSNSASTTNHPSKKYPKPLIFHDGRLAFLPTPAATLSLLLWLPFSFLLSLVRILAGVLLPYRLSLIIGAALGIHFRVRLSSQTPANTRRDGAGGVLFVCTHRTLLDPIFLRHALSRPIPVVTYSLSRFTESISPIPTVRLSRDRRRDADTMRRLLSAGDLAVCPEGTTCREPYLLRFSPLFAELAAEIEPVAINAESSMFYATTATGKKSLDPFFFFMNPTPGYRVSFLGRVPKELTVAGGWTAAEVANRIQGELAEDLGFHCTALTRRDKYLALAKNDGVVHADPPPYKF
ncbi:Glycerol-3-phosphate acyltransferase 1 [Platanthera zijinensis]|uniref:Glycerol-3-phosphate acyltransferase 1 n=1 Tax=Platanthera zijinensis TaxID=2320716 RepID=A0AAP0B8D4_9ASPA